MAKKQPQNREKKNGATSTINVGAILLKKWWITALVIAFVLGGIILLYIYLPVVANKSESEAIIKIPANATSEIVHDSVAKYLGDDFAANVMKAAKLRGTDFSKRHGAYLIEKEMSPLKAERRLGQGGQLPITVVINGARGLEILATRISKSIDLTSDSLINYLAKSGVCTEYGIKTEQSLALFTDDSYEFYWNVTPADFIKKIGDNYKKIWTPDRLEKAEKLGLTPAEVIIIASIVDEETNKTDEKPKVARLYLNRLAKNMKLQADPTVKFALGDFTLKRIRGEHLKVDSPYNTYRVAGLPPGPIKTVTVADIDAVLNAPGHDYLYMCAKDDFSGYHNFAKDYNTHTQNARKYQIALNRRNIK